MSTDESNHPDMKGDSFVELIPDISSTNHKELFEANARLVGQVYAFEEEKLAFTECGPDRHSMVLFPENPSDASLDQMMDIYTQSLPKTIGVWKTFDSDENTQILSAKLLARGFQLGWEPQWMGLELDQAHLEPRQLEDVKISQGNAQIPSNVPFSSSNDDSIYAVQLRESGQVVKFVARTEKDGAIIGHTDIFFGSSAGLYNVGVDPDYTGRGIGSELVRAACLLARQKGFSNVTLNGTGRKMYEKLGFIHAGNGATWWLHRVKYALHPNNQDQIKIIQLVCLDELEELKKLATNEDVDLKFPTANGMSLVEMAIHFGYSETAKWLIFNDAPHSVVDLWDLSKSRANTMLPRHVNDLIDGKTPLHHAVERGDEDFVKFLLNHSPDLEIKDSTYESTPLGWAGVLGRSEIGKLLIEAGAKPKKEETPIE